MIYFLEDDASIQKLVCYALAKEGYEIKGMSLPSEFWKEIQEEIPELILLDIMLPEEDGISILKKLREDKKYQDIPVIMIAKYFERIGDHAENIAEWVIYSITGKHAKDDK